MAKSMTKKAVEDFGRQIQVRIKWDPKHSEWQVGTGQRAYFTGSPLDAMMTAVDYSVMWAGRAAVLEATATLYVAVIIAGWTNEDMVLQG